MPPTSPSPARKAVGMVATSMFTTSTSDRFSPKDLRVWYRVYWLAVPVAVSTFAPFQVSAVP